MLINSDFLGQGWAFPVAPDIGGTTLQWSSGAQNIKQSIEIILTSRPGERVMVPTFGCRLCELSFAADQGTTHALAERYVQQALMTWEPRIAVQQIGITTPPEFKGCMLVSIDYVILASNRPDNMVYPFYFK